jgi:hypothetical protein
MDARTPSRWRKVNWHRLCRMLLVLMVLANFAVLQTASAVETHAHHHGGPNDHCCPGCHGGHFPLLQPAGSIQVAALTVAGWRKALDTAPRAFGGSRTLNSCRAPPA